jgi:hypothetical protein
MARVEPRERLGSKPSCVMSSRRPLAVEQSEHDLFAEQGRQHRHTEVDLAAGAAIVETAPLMRPSCGRRFLGDVQPRHDLDARHERIAELERRGHHGLQHAVDAEPHAQFLFVRLDVNVTGAALNRRQEQRVGEPDDRRFAALLLERGRVESLRRWSNDLDFFLSSRDSGPRARGRRPPSTCHPPRRCCPRASDSAW